MIGCFLYRIYQADAFLVQVLKIFKAVSIIATEPRIGTDPYKTFAILEYFKNFRRGKALVTADILNDITGYLRKKNGPPAPNYQERTNRYPFEVSPKSLQ